MAPPKTSIPGCLLLILAVLVSGCAGGGQKEAAAGKLDADDPMALDFGQDWIELEAAPRTTSSRLAGPADTTRSTYWTVLLRTFSDDNHQTAGATMVSNLPRVDPRSASAHVHTTSKGSMVVYGVFDAVDSDDAKDALEMVKAIEIRGRTVFPRAMLTRVSADPTGSRLRPIDLMSVRRRYPRLSPLYSLQVGVWGGFGELEPAEVKRRAESHVMQLRARRYEAYVYHDDDQNLSMVTVGLFDHTAIDAGSGLYSAEVDELIAEFPQHLVNGEPLAEMIDSRRPGLGTKIQQPKLVLVPEM